MKAKRKPAHQATLRLIKVTLELQRQVQLLRLEIQSQRVQPRPVTITREMIGS